MRAAFIVSALTFIAPALSAPTPVPLTKRAGPVNPESYIIKLRDGISLENLVYALTEKLSGSDSSITHKYAPLWNGFAATLKGEDLNLVRQMPEVESVLEDSILSLAEHEEGGALDLVPSTASKHYAQLAGRGNADGSGVTIYGIDTGIYTGHSCFEGRAKPGISFVQAEPDSEDHNGHGTHTAGTAIVLGASGSGTTSGVMMGVQWACAEFKKNKKPSIATMSLGGPGLPFSPLNEIIEACIRQGLHFTVAAGNANVAADGTSPANAANANTIGAADTRGDKANKPEKAPFSNYGSYIDVWAPGVSITSAWIGGPDAKNTISGTSMATPDVAGLLAVMLSKCPKMDDPKILSDELKNHAVQQVTFTNATQADATPNKGMAQLWDCDYE